MTVALQDYVHDELNREVTAIGGHYVFIKEVLLPFRGEEVLYRVGYGVVDNSCCGIGGCAYTLVVGFIRRWHKGIQEGLPVSEIESIRDSKIQNTLRHIIEQKEKTLQVTFQ